MKEELLKLVVEISKIESAQMGNRTDSLQNLLNKSFMVEDKDIPKWLLSLFYGILNQKEIAEQNFIDNEKVKLYYFFNELAELIGLDIEDEGEYTTLFFKNLNMQAIIIWQGYTYELIRV